MLIDTVAIVVVLAVALLAGLIVFGTAAPPKVTDAMRAPFARVELADLPALASFNARDGAALAYRLYSADGSRVILLVHGSAGASESMHALAKALQAAGTTVYAMDVRGRGGSGTPGDIAYVGQLEDDLADVTQLLREKHPAASVSLVGYSSGAGLQATTYLVSRYAGLRKFGTIFGTIASMMLAGTAIGPLVAGRVHDVTGAYTALLMLASPTMLVCALLFVGLGPYPDFAARDDQSKAPEPA